MSFYKTMNGWIATSDSGRDFLIIEIRNTFGFGFRIHKRVLVNNYTGYYAELSLLFWRLLLELRKPFRK